jgi:hypothetical protein
MYRSIPLLSVYNFGLIQTQIHQAFFFEAQIHQA